MKKFYSTILFALLAMTSFAQEKNDTVYVMMDFTQNPWNYPVREVTSGWAPDFKDLDSPGAILKDTDFSWSVSEGSSEKVKVTLYAVDLDEYNKVSVYGHVDINDAEASAFGVSYEKINVLYTTNGSTMRFESPKGYKFGKIVFYNFHSSNFLVGDEYDEEHVYVYNDNSFKQKLKVWKPTSPKKNSYDYNTWEGDETNILFNYPYFNAHFVKIDVRLVPDGSAGINELATEDAGSKTAVTLDGRTVNKSNGLRKCIYIINGKKHLVGQ